MEDAHDLCWYKKIFGRISSSYWRNSNDRKIVIAPPFTAISTFSNYTNFDYLNIASQNIHWEDKGAFTAEISPRMLIEHKVKYAIVGHSEPRKYFS